MKYSKTALMELSHKYKSILKKCTFLNMAILMGMVVSTPVMADAPITDRPVFVFGDMAMDSQNVETGAAAFGGRRMNVWENGKYQNDFPKYQMSGRSFDISNSDIYVGPVTLTLRELTDEDKVSFNYQENEVDTDLAEKAGIEWNDTIDTVVSKISSVIGQNNAAYTAPAVYVFSQRDDSKKAGTLLFDNTTAMIDGATINANSISVTNASEVSFVKQDKSKLGAFYDSNIDSDGVTTVNADTIEFDSSRIIVDSKASVTFNATGEMVIKKALSNKNGGAVYNEGSLTFLGTTVFNGNQDSTGSNDIYNDGTITFDGDVTLDGGISGNGTVTFAEGTSLTAALQKTTILANTVTFAGNNTLNLIVANGLANADYDFITAGTLNGEDNVGVNVADNAIYNLKLTEDGKINVSVKSGAEIVDSIDASATEEEGETLSAVITSNGSGTDVGNEIADAISTALQTGKATEAVKAAKDLAPTTSQQVMGVAQSVNSLISNVAGNRMTTLGRAGGDMFIGGSIWAQGLYNYTKQDTTDSVTGFSADTQGVALGVDGKVSRSVTVGLGYGYNKTDVDSDGRSIAVDGHNFFAYAQYQPNNWYINGMFSYGLNKYIEEKAPMGIAMEAKYDVHTYAANVMTGYNLRSGITSEAGLRYVLANQESYNDGAQYISTDNNDVLTAVIGFKYNKNLKTKGCRIKPSVRLAATYDIISDNSRANINVIGGGNYQITGERLHRFGVETGLGVAATVKNWDLMLEYNAGFRKDFQNHTGTLKLKYNF